MPATKKSAVDSFNDNFKKTVTEMLLLELLDEQETYIGDLAGILRERSEGRLSLSFPYAAIYRLLEDEYIEELKKRNAPDGRRRQFYAITKSGRAYLKVIKQAYKDAVEAVDMILSK